MCKSTAFRGNIQIFRRKFCVPYVFSYLCSKNHILARKLNMATYYKELFQLLRKGLGISDEPVSITDPTVWQWIFTESQWQSILGVIFVGIDKNASVSKPPTPLVLKWVMEAERLKKANAMFDKEAKRLTEFFDSNGMHSTILKGQGNEMLYPIRGLRMPGDIDIYVEGGKKHVKQWLLQHNLMNENELQAQHHIHFKSNGSRIEVEVHFLPSSGIFNKWKNHQLLAFLNDEIQHSVMTEKGFRVPTFKFNLLMQLAHIQRHFIEGGIGLRQITDYYYVLRHASDEERQEAAALILQLGMKKMTSALMWVLHEVFHLEEKYFLTQPNRKLGEFLLSEICAGGNFGYRADKQYKKTIARSSHKRLRALHLMKFSVAEVFWSECYYWSFILHTIPERIKRGKFSLYK